MSVDPTPDPENQVDGDGDSDVENDGDVAAEDSVVEESDTADTEVGPEVAATAVDDDPGAGAAGPDDATPPEDVSTLVDRLITAGAVGALISTVAVLSGAAWWAAVLAVVASVASLWVIDERILPGLTRPDRSDAPFAPSPTFGVAASPPASGGVDDETASASPAATRRALNPTRARPDSVEAVDLVRGRSHVYRVRLAPHGEPLAASSAVATVEPRRATVAIAGPLDDVDGADDAVLRFATATTDAFAADPPAPLSPRAFRAWLGGARSLVASDDPVEISFAGASFVRDDASRVAVVMTVGACGALVVRPRDGVPVVAQVVRGDRATSLPSHDRPGSRGDVSAPSWTSVPVPPGDRLVLASSQIIDWVLADTSRLVVLERESAADVGRRLADERTAGHLADGSVALAVVALGR